MFGGQENVPASLSFPKWCSTCFGLCDRACVIDDARARFARARLKSGTTPMLMGEIELAHA